jgi:hypothetical protein
MPDPFDPYKAPQASLDGLPPANPSAAVPPSLIELLAQTRPWVRLISVLIFVGMGLGVLGTLVMGAVGARSGMPGSGAVSAAMFIPMLFVMALYIPPALFLWQYAAKIRQLQNGGGMPSLEEALSRQKSFWKYIGILAAVMLGLYAFAIVGAGMFGALMSRH